MRVVVVVLIIASLSGLIGMAIGKGKDRQTAGFWLGFFLGWIGWIVVAVMSRTPEAEARRTIAIDSATQRLTGAVPARLSPIAQRTNSKVLATIYDLARNERDAAGLHAAVDQFASSRQLARPVLDWFFASNPSAFVVRHDGRMFESTATSVRGLDRTAEVSYTADDEGRLLSVTVGGTTFAEPRPNDPARRLLATVSATCRVVAAAPVVALPPPSPGDSALSVAMRTLQQLHVDGLISDEEYDRKRRELIDRI